MQRMSKMSIIIIFAIFQGLGTCSESKEETSNFIKMFCVTATEENMSKIWEKYSIFSP